MKEIDEKAIDLHRTHQGKIEVNVKVPCDNAEDLTKAYTPGVAAICKAIEKNKEELYTLTSVGKSVAVITDGSAVLGLGNIGPYAAYPVMEGKQLLLKRFADLDGWPICVNTQDTEKFIETVKLIAPSFKAINLEDISAPRCIEIEQRLDKELDIPVFHDDQHGTAIVVLAALINSMKLIHKDPNDCKVVVSGTGAAGSNIIKMIYEYGFRKIYAFDIDGNLSKENSQNYSDLKKDLLNYVNLDNQNFETLKQAIKGADVFIGVSVKGLVTKEMVASMNHNAVVMALANPDPEISYDEAIEAGAAIVCTGRSDRPNQVNNVLAFPGIFKGAIEGNARNITKEMKLAASIALANYITEDKLSTTHVIPNAFDEGVCDVVAKAVKDAIK